MTEEQSDIVIETPSSAFSDLSDDVKADIEKSAEEWKMQKTSGGKKDLTDAIKKKYKENIRAYEYFKALKIVRKDGSMPRKKIILKSPETLAREEYAIILRECMQKYFKNNQKIDQNSKVFLLDENYNLPPYFWVRMNTKVLPTIMKEMEGNTSCELHAWQLAIGITKKHEDELASRLLNTNFSDLNHVSNTIIQFLNKYMLTTYKELMQKARQQVIDKKKYENKIKYQENIPIDNHIKKRGGGVKEVKNVAFDTSELL